jgi:hypothetical protein
MRKFACLTLSLLATGGVAAVAASSASASSVPTPCPVQPVVQPGSGSVTVNPPCVAEGKVGSVTVPLP